MSEEEKMGPLVIIGGHEEREGKMTILREFARLSGGSRARIVLMTAASQVPEEMDAEYRRAFGEIGVEEFRALETTARAEADSAKSLGVVDRATGVLFTGGDQDRLIRILHDTRLAALLHKKRREDGLVIAGTSAGASMMSDVMLDEGDSAECPRAGITKLVTGMGFLPGVIVDQHFSQRGRMGRLLSAVAQRPDCLGVGIGEDTAMVVEGPTFRAIGIGVVTVVDGSRMSYNNSPHARKNEPLTLAGLWIHAVGPGHAFDLANRTLLPEGGASAVA